MSNSATNITLDCLVILIQIVAIVLASLALSGTTWIEGVYQEVSNCVPLFHSYYFYPLLFNSHLFFPLLFHPGFKSLYNRLYVEVCIFVVRGLLV